MALRRHRSPAAPAEPGPLLDIPRWPRGTFLAEPAPSLAAIMLHTFLPTGLPPDPNSSGSMNATKRPRHRDARGSPLVRLLSSWRPQRARVAWATTTRCSRNGRCAAYTANTRQDGEEFLALAARVAIRMDIVSYPMSDALCALSELAHGRSSGAAAVRSLKAQNGEDLSVTGAALGPSSRARAVICLWRRAYPERGSKVPGRCR